MPHEHVLNRLRAEYLEIPGLRLTREQLQGWVARRISTPIKNSRLRATDGDLLQARETSGVCGATGQNNSGSWPVTDERAIQKSRSYELGAE
jgi:hypothetical protein